MKEIIKKEQQNVTKVQTLEQQQREAIEIAEEYYLPPRGGKIKSYNSSDLWGGTSEAENYSGARPKTNLKANPIAYAHSILPQEAVTTQYRSQLESRQDHALEHHAALLRDEVFDIIPGKINMQHGTICWEGKRANAGKLLGMLRYWIVVTYLRYQWHP